ncbi:MAG: sodium:solute symporter family protein [Chloroflexota bacterium]|nr:sodium:solute symporter family protein [Chloroflexota bacterium]
MWPATILAYVVVTLFIGVRYRAATLTAFVRGDALDTPVMVATIVSTFYGASSILGGVSLAYAVGLGAVWFMIPFYLGSIAIAFLVQGIANSEPYTLPDFLGGFYGDRFAVASSMLLATLCLIPEEIIAGGKILSAFAPVSAELGMAVMTFVLVVPVVIGGMRADVTTDVVQFVLMILMLGLLIPFGLHPGPLADLPAEHLNPLAHLSVQEMAVFSVALFFLPITSAPLYQRLFVSRSEAEARRAMLASVAIWILIDTIVVLAGLAAVRALPGLNDPDVALIELGRALPLAGQTIFFVGLLAVIMTTVNSFLQSGASSLAYDVWRHVKPSAGDRELLTLSRAFVVALGLLSLFLALWLRAIVPALLFTLSMWTAGMLIPTLAALLRCRMSERVALSALLGGTLFSLAWRILHPLAIDPLFVGLGGSLLTALITGLVERHRHP